MSTYSSEDKGWKDRPLKNIQNDGQTKEQKERKAYLALRNIRVKGDK